MSNLPEVIFPSATEINGPRDVGYGVFYTILSEVTKEDYLAYTDYLKDEGYKETASCVTVSSAPLDVSTWRNGSRFVVLRHAPERKTWMAYYEDADFHTWTANDVLEGIPDVNPDEAEHVGAGIYMVCKENVEETEFQKYLEKLEEDHFSKYVENRIAENVFSVTYTKNRVVISVLYLKMTGKLYVQAGLDVPLSEHLHYDESYCDGIIAGKQTTLAMLQMTRLGSSFVIQLRNGHYIVNDGGFGCELEKLLTYLEKHATDGEKPVVEAWVVSHAHPDHCGVLVMMAEHPEYAKRVQVDGIYFNEPSELKRALDPGGANYQILGMYDAAKLLGTKIYRMQTGQRYYFCDITMDVLLSSEQVSMKIHSNDLNDTSTWCLYTIDGQTCMLAGDADRGCCRAFADIYEKGYWKFDVFTAFHHGSNTSDVMTEHCEFQTVLVSRAEQPKKHPEENANLRAKSKEWFIKGEGTRVLTFPYRVGESMIEKDFDLEYEKTIIENAVKAKSALMKEAHDYIWTNPETGYREVKTSAYLEKAFEELGYELVKAGDIPGFYTIFDTGRPGPEVLVLGELDSLICREHPDADPATGAVHCCGHSMQSATLLGIAAALKTPGVTEKWCGKIRLCAVPAEELIEIAYRTKLRRQGKIRYMGGKTEFLYRGYFDDVDLAFMIHTTPSNYSSANLGSVGCLSKRVIYKGVSAHAGGSPWNGCNALYAANLGLNAVNAIRETFQEKDLIRVHPIITQGGGAVNAIPDQVVIESYVRGKSLEAIAKANERVNKALCGAALSLGANIDIEDIPGYAPLNNCQDLVSVVEEAVTTMTEVPFKRESVFGTGSTDMGDLSAIMPAVHPYMPGAKGTSHGSNYIFEDPEKACVDSAIVQVYMLHLLLKDNGERAKEIVANFVPQFASKEAYFECVDAMERSGERIQYTEDGNAKIEL